jgi:two-component system phosphate regulon response regulator PhoB
MKSLIFVVDNQPEVCEFARECLESAGYAVVTCSGIGTGCELKGRPSLVILGIGVLEESSSFDQLFESYGLDEVPRIILLESGTSEQRRIAVDSRAADSIVKPFTREELVTRVRSLLVGAAFRGSKQESDEPDLVIDSWAMRLLVRGIEIPTTTLEFRLVEYMARHRGQVFTRDFLLDAVWGDMRFINPRSVDACIRRIREKIEQVGNEPSILKTVRGIGYRLDAGAAWLSAPRRVCDCPACTAKISVLQSHAPGAARRRPPSESSSAN